MSNTYTYQEKATSSSREKYEWERIWFEDIYDRDAKRVLYIGDSISNATFPHAAAASERKILFNNFASSKALDNPFYYPMIKMFIEQNERVDAIIVNNGLHGWHLTEDEYEQCYLDLVRKLKADNPKTPIFLVLSTTTDESRAYCARVPVRNEKAIRVAQKEGLGIIDIHKISVENKHLLSQDGVHFTPDGYKLFGAEIVNVLKERI